jgi:hypothetical protein
MHGRKVGSPAKKPSSHSPRTDPLRRLSELPEQQAKPAHRRSVGRLASKQRERGLPSHLAFFNDPLRT